MNTTVTRSRTVKTYWLAVEDGEVRPQPHSSSGRMYRVARVEAVKSDGNFTKVTLGGPILKKDGSDSLNICEELMYQQSAWPNWLRSAIGGLA